MSKEIFKINEEIKGFTLLELLLVMALASIVIGLMIVAISPGRQLAQARNSSRASDIRSIHSAIRQYNIENVSWPSPNLTSNFKEICDSNNKPTGCVNINNLAPTYIQYIPRDPLYDANSEGTGYHVLLDETSQMITVIAVNSTENEQELLIEGGSQCNQQCLVLIKSGLLGYWPLNNNTNDYSGRGRDGGSTDAEQIEGKSGGAYRFDGSNAIEIPAWGLPYGSSPRTTCLWARINNLNESSNFRWALSYGNSESGENWNIGTSGTIGNLQVGSLGLTLGNTKTIQSVFKKETWTNICTSYDGNKIYTYLNGIKALEVEHSYNTIPNQAFIGKQGLPGQPENWIGDIDEVSMWDRKLSDLEILHVFNKGRSLNLKSI